MSLRLPAVFKGKAELEAAYRFFDNDLVIPSKILRSHFTAARKRVAQFPIVLLIQDSTDIDLKHMDAVADIGVLNDTQRPGFSCHPLVAFTPDRLCLGVIANEFLIRPPEGLGKKRHNNCRPIEEKESYRWIKHYKVACEVAQEAADTKIIVIADREADIFELFLEAQGKPAHLLVRMWHDRKLGEKDISTGLPTMLKHEIVKAQIIGEINFVIPAGRGRKKREVTQNIRSREFTLAPSGHKKKLPNIKINVIFLEEVNPPIGEEPCNWILGTTLPISNEEEVRQILDFYLARWGIETYFKVLKSGCLVEKVQLQNASRVLNCLVLYMIIAWRLLYITYLGRTCPDLPCSIVFDKSEWQSVYAVVKNRKPPDQPILLSAFIELVAILGGYQKNKKHPPGPNVMWIGLQAMRGCSYGWTAAKKFGMN